MSNGKLKIGWAKADITPNGPTMLAGQMHNRLATVIATRLWATALAFDNGSESCILISIDAVGFRKQPMDKCREKISAEIGVKPENIICSVTHTHTAPQAGRIIPMSECMQYLLNSAVPRGNCGIDVDEVREKYPDFVDSEQYIEFLIDKISAAAVEAWKKRADGSFAYGQGNAVVGECRRMVMKDKGGLMYTQENDPAMLNVEGHVDHNVNIIATYDVQGSLTGIVVNVACPAQAGEALSVISADFWDDVRKETSRRFGENVYVLPQCSAAGDQSPHLLLRRRADARMMCLRGQLSKPLERWEWGRRVYDAEYASARCKELGRRIADAIEDVLPLIADTRCSEPEFICSCREIQLSGRIITKQEADEARENADKLEAVCKAENIPYDGMVPWYRGVVQRYENQTPKTPMELHVVRLGDIVFATNTFELYLDYGDRIKGQSKAMQTFLIQLAAGMGTYLPSQRSTGGYGSVPASSLVTFSGGDELVEETLKDINALF